MNQISVISTSIASTITILLFFYGIYLWTLEKIKGNTKPKLKFDINYNLLSSHKKIQNIIQKILIDRTILNYLKIEIINKEKNKYMNSISSAYYAFDTSTELEDIRSKIEKCFSIIFNENAIHAYRYYPNILNNLDKFILDILQSISSNFTPTPPDSLSLDIYVNLSNDEQLTAVSHLDQKEKDELLKRKNINDVNVFTIPKFLIIEDFESFEWFNIENIFIKFVHKAILSNYFGKGKNLNNENDLEKIFSKYYWDIGLH